MERREGRDGRERMERREYNYHEPEYLHNREEWEEREQYGEGWDYPEQDWREEYYYGHYGYQRWRDDYQDRRWSYDSYYDKVGQTGDLLMTN